MATTTLNYSRFTHAELVNHALDQAPVPLDDAEIRKVIEHRFGRYITPSSCRSRRAELVKAGTVKQAEGVYTTSPTGVKCQTWTVA